jgi:hypothetical protein
VIGPELENLKAVADEKRNFRDGQPKPNPKSSLLSTFYGRIPHIELLEYPFA